MQGTYCNPDYNRELLREAARKVVFQGDLGALAEINLLINEVADCEIELLPLDKLILSYIYHVWMPMDLKQDFKAMKTWLTLEEYSVFQLVQRHGTDPLKSDNYSDIYGDIIFDIANEVIYRYTDGACGEIRERKNISRFLFDMINSHYCQIRDDVLMLLFIGYHYYAEDLFSNQLEAELFKAFVYRKKELLYHSEEDNVVLSIEEKLREMEF